MPVKDCVLCHPELYGKNKNWTVLCRDHMNACVAHFGSLMDALDKMDEWIRAQLKEEGKK